jgi:hypothetical protein
MGKANINGQEFSFVDSKLTIAGVELFSATTITAKEKQEKTNNYGNQPQPVSRGRGKKEYEASFDLALKDVLKLKRLSATGKLTDLPASNAIIFLDNGTDKYEIVLPYFEFSEDGLDIKDGDTEARTTYPGIMSDIIFTDLTV